MAHINLLEELRIKAEPGQPVRHQLDKMIYLKGKLNGAKQPFKIFIDDGSQVNIITPFLAKQCGLQVLPVPRAAAEAINGTPLKIYGVAQARLALTDSKGTTLTEQIWFVVAEVQPYSMVLGMPWLETHNPRVDYSTKKLVFRMNTPTRKERFRKIGLETPEQFWSTMTSPKSDLYVCSVTKLAQDGLIELLKEYEGLEEVASFDDSASLPEHGQQDLAIELVSGKSPPYSPLYNLSEAELTVLRKYLDEYLARGWIRRSKSPAGAPILFAKKKDGSLRLCVDYRALNDITVKNRHPLLLIQESLDRLARARVYTKLDIRDAYHRMRIRHGDEWKTAFRTRYGHFEYLVVPFGLTNAPAAFQAYINQALVGLIDVVCVIYLDDILVFSNSLEEHYDHVRQVLRRLIEHKLYIKLSKCEFHTTETEFLGFKVSPRGVRVDPERLKTVDEWPEPRTVRDIRVFIGFMNYYRRFIRHFSRLALPLTKLTQKGPDSAKGGRAQRREESVKIDIGEKGRESFLALKRAFMVVPILAHFDPSRPNRVETDASGGAISGVYSQLVPSEAGKAQWRPIVFYSRKMIQAEYNYDIYDKELLAIVKTLEHCRQYLEGAEHPFDLYTDHNNLLWFLTTKTLNRRQARWAQKLAEFHFTIKHTPGESNPADGPSRRPDYVQAAQIAPETTNLGLANGLRDKLFPGASQNTSAVAAVLIRSQTTIKRPTIIVPSRPKPKKLDFDEREPTREPSPTVDPAANAPTDKRAMVSLEPPLDRIGPMEPAMEISDPQGIEDLDLATLEPQPEASESTHGKFVPQGTEAKAKALMECHDNPLAGHFGYKRTLEKLKRRYHWKGML